MCYAHKIATVAKHYWDICKEKKYEVCVVGIGDAMAITTKEGSKVMMTAVQLNPKEINEAEDNLAANLLMSISVS